MNMIERIARVIAEEDQAQHGAAPYDEIVSNSDSREILFNLARAAQRAMMSTSRTATLSDDAFAYEAVRVWNKQLDKEFGQLNSRFSIIWF